MVNKKESSTPKPQVTSPIGDRKSKSIPRCVSMCSSENDILQGKGCSLKTKCGDACMKDAQKRNGRKRPRSSSDTPSMVGLGHPPPSKQQFQLNVESQLHGKLSGITTPKNSATDTSADTTISSTAVKGNNFQGTSSVASKASGKSPLSPFTRIPASPVRSVVSCDGDSDHGEPPQPLSRISEEEFDRNSKMHQECNDSIELKKSTLPQNLQLHLRGLLIEANLAPMKPLLYRLITHQTYNRKGTFNYPVDPVALGLKDYSTIIKRPMDLGTIKTKLLSNLYAETDENGEYIGKDHVAKDIKLVFQNACLFNPPLHPIHEAAKHLLAYFDDHYSALLKKSGESSNNLRAAPTLPHFPAVHKVSHAQTSLPSMTSMHNSFLNPSVNGKFTNMPLPGRQLLLAPVKHTCQSCDGKTCNLCKEGCLCLEPSLLICAGSACAGSKIRRNINYYCTVEGTKTWCQKCYSSLPATIPNDDGDMTIPTNQLFKRDLLKRKNEEDVVERWITCSKCKAGMHEVCAFVSEFCTDRESFVCPLCIKASLPGNPFNTDQPRDDDMNRTRRVHSFLTGKENPELVEDSMYGTPFDSRSISQCEISDFIETKVKERMVSLGCPKDAESTLTVRVISDHDREFNVPDVVHRHFRWQEVSDSNTENSVPSGITGVQTFSSTPSSISYRFKAISLFQRIDGMDVCIFSMYVQEYDGERNTNSNQQKRVYIAYIDSVEHLRPRRLRTTIYHEILVAYIATARARRFEFAHIWSCPPTRGNSFVFWAHPSSQRTPSKELLLKWYHNAIILAVNRGIVTDVKSLYEQSFQQFDRKRSKANVQTDPTKQPVMIAPALLDGDFWIEEAARVYSASASRGVKTKKVVGSIDEIPFSPNELFLIEHSKSPVMQVATLIKDFIMRHPLSQPFHVPVNAVALKLLDYHDIIKKPMDLGTVLNQCFLGDYDTFTQVFSDLDLVFQNTMRYNPKGHIIHNMADELWTYTKEQLSILVNYWQSVGIRSQLAMAKEDESSFTNYGDVSMKLSSMISSLDCSTSGPSTSSSQKERNIIPACHVEEKDYQPPKDCIDNSTLLFQGPDGIAKLMVGEDTFLLDKRHAQKEALKKKKKGGKKKKTAENSSETDQRRESWLGDEVLSAVRSLRKDIFVCRLSPKPYIEMSNIEREKDKEFSAYVRDFEVSCTSTSAREMTCKSCITPELANTRHGLLEFSQYCNLQFDTIRRAKYSTAMLLYYLQNPDTSGIIPICFHCNGDITDVRWRRVNKAFDERRRSTLTISIRTTSVDMSREEVCGKCYQNLDKKRKDDFIPIRVSFRRNV